MQLENRVKELEAKIKGDLLFANGKYCIVRKAKNNYELMIVGENKNDSFIRGKMVCETGSLKLPSTSEWGTKGWTCISAERAFDKMKELIGR